MVVILNPANVAKCLLKAGVGIGGDPLVGFGYYAGTSAVYQKIAEVTIPAGKVGFIKSISFAADAGSEDRAEFKLTFGATVMFEGKKCIGGALLEFDDLVEVAAGTVVTVWVKSDGANEIKANGIITGRVV